MTGYFGDDAAITEIDGEIIPPRHGEGDRRRRWRGTFRESPRQKVRIVSACPSPMLRMVPVLILGRICNHHPSPQRRLGPIAPVDLARHT